jgi:sec-independent protein translocase protein TatC
LVTSRAISPIFALCYCYFACIPMSVPNHPNDMSFIDHLEELRWHLMRSIVAITLITIVAFLLKSWVFDTLIFGPCQDDFFTYDAFCQLAHKLNLGDSLCFKPANFTLINTDMSGQFTMHLQVAMVLGFIAAFPYIFWEMWRFIEPGLNESERKYTKGIVIASSLLFFMGVLFGYYIITPFSINFLAGYYVSDHVANTISLTSYVGTLTSIILASGIMFELPMLVFFLAKMGLIYADWMRQYRRHALVVILFIAAVITPPDVWSQVLVTIPVYLLYEAGIWVAAVVEKRDGLEMSKEIVKSE